MRPEDELRERVVGGGRRGRFGSVRFGHGDGRAGWAVS
ncbi:hypothetical protein EV383_4309 [Pseudonocardia sediminis]|uniref:Uncharacterized protein n=1 Tax=Pseudonocardia sediminis TaxID=1397368 RepID=A0A4Q7V464_PSEST|nr:hypothetical protein EV383_4309 [Pseudonocardia sediminis]